MPKLKNDPIQKNDLIDYLDSCSDFSFELSILKMLRERSIDCEHGGLYEDPITGKSREFDIRAIKTIKHLRIRLAIECKNIRDHFPVLISCVPRNEVESFHQIALVGESKSSEHSYTVPIYKKSRAKILSIRNEYSIYKINEPVGKSTVQVGRALDGKISANDGELYDKWSQSLSSSTDLMSRMYWDADEKDDKNRYLSTVIPIVVVPNGRLWSVLYDDNGRRVQDPSPVERCSCFVNKDYEVGTKKAGTRMLISHIEIMTIDGLKDFIESNLKSFDGMLQIFSKEGISEAISRESEK